MTHHTQTPIHWCLSFYIELILAPVWSFIGMILDQYVAVDFLWAFIVTFYVLFWC